MVLLNLKEPNAQDWEELAFFPHVYYLHGSPLIDEDLLRAGVVRAIAAVVLPEMSLGEGSICSNCF